MEIADDDAMEIATEEVRADVVTVTHGDAAATEKANRVEEEVVTAEVVVEHHELAETPVAHVVLGDNRRCRRIPLHLIDSNLRNSGRLTQT